MIEPRENTSSFAKATTDGKNSKKWSPNIFCALRARLLAAHKAASPGRDNSSQSIRGAQGLYSLSVKHPLEIGERSGQFRGGHGLLKEGREGEHLSHLRKVGRVVGSQINYAAGCERLPGGLGKMLVHKAMLVVFALGPGVGKIEVDGLGGMERQQVLQKVGSLDPRAAQVDQPEPPAFAVDLA